VPADVETVARELGPARVRGGAVEGSNGVIDFEITANRPDCLSHVGIAREAAAIWGTPLKAAPGHAGEQGAASPGRRRSRPDLCPRYARRSSR
jgi:phenylalanyl-tRNA synthetase beta chain